MAHPVTIEPIRWQPDPARVTIRPNGGQPEIIYQTTTAMNIEGMCRGRPVEELPRILPILGPAHHLAAALALDDVFGVEPPPVAANIRTGIQLAQTFVAHLRKLYFLLSSQTDPFVDFWKASRRPAASRRLKRAMDDVMHHLALGQEVETILGGRSAHPLTAVAGGVSRFLKEADYERLADIAANSLAFTARLSECLHKEVFDPQRLYEIFGESEITPLAALALQGAEGVLSKDNGEGEKGRRFPVSRVFETIGLHHESWSRLPFAFIREKGWGGWTQETSDSLCFVGPLARLDRCGKLPTPLAEQERRHLVDSLGSFPHFGSSAGTWALLVELIQCAEKMVALFQKEKLTGPAVRSIPTEMKQTGHGAVESPEGAVFHEYRVDDRGIVQEVRILAAAVLNNAPRCRLVQRIVLQALEQGADAAAVKERVERCLLPF